MNPRKGLLILMAAAVMAGCSDKPAPETPLRLVKTVTFGNSLETIGVVVQPEVTVVKNPAALAFDGPGRIMEWLVSKGQSVSVGQALARLDPHNLALSETSARTQLVAAQAELSAAEADFKRYSELREKGFISVAEYDRRLAQIVAARARFEAFAEQLGYITLRAIEPGRVSDILAAQGADVAARQVVVRLSLDAPARQRPAAKALDSAVAYLPLSAVMGDQTVFRVSVQPDGSGLLQKVAVKTGRMTESSIEIVQGLSKGERVIAAGTHVLSDGERVRLVGSPISQ